MHTRNSFLRRLRILWPAALLALLVGCAGVKVRTDYNHAVNFSQFHTYSWLKVKSSNTLWSDRIRHDVDEQLASKGWREVPSGGDAAVSAFGSTKEQHTLETFYSGFGPDFGGWYWLGWGDGGFATTQDVVTPIGSVTVDIFNANTKRLIWRGTTEQVLSDKAGSNARRLEHAMADLFKTFPPQNRREMPETEGGAR